MSDEWAKTFAGHEPVEWTFLSDEEIVGSLGHLKPGQRLRFVGQDGAPDRDITIADVIVEKDERGRPTGTVTVIPEVPQNDENPAQPEG